MKSYKKANVFSNYRLIFTQHKNTLFTFLCPVNKAFFMLLISIYNYSEAPLKIFCISLVWFIRQLSFYFNCENLLIIEAHSALVAVPKGSSLYVLKSAPAFPLPLIMPLDMAQFMAVFAQLLTLALSA